MSVKTMARVWDHSKQTSSARVLMLAIADRADHEGVCWYSKAKLAKLVKVNTRQIAALAEKAEQEGELLRVLGVGKGKRQTSNRYLVTVGLTIEEIADTLRTHEQLQHLSPAEVNDHLEQIKAIRNKVAESCNDVESNTLPHAGPNTLPHAEDATPRAVSSNRQDEPLKIAGATDAPAPPSEQEKPRFKLGQRVRIKDEPWQKGAVSAIMRGPGGWVYDFGDERGGWTLEERYLIADWDDPHQEGLEGTWATVMGTADAPSLKADPLVEDQPSFAPPKGKGRKKPPADSHPNTRPILDAYAGELGYPIPNGGKEAKAAKMLAQGGYTPEQVAGCYRYMKAQEFWRTIHVSLCKVHEQIGAWLQSQVPQHIPPAARATSGYTLPGSGHMINFSALRLPND